MAWCLTVSYLAPCKNILGRKNPHCLIRRKINLGVAGQCNSHACMCSTFAVCALHPHALDFILFLIDEAGIANETLNSSYHQLPFPYLHLFSAYLFLLQTAFASLSYLTAFAFPSQPSPHLSAVSSAYW